MATSRPLTDPTPETITISNGVPSSTSVTISQDQDIIFDNEDDEDYLLQLWSQGNNHQIDICPVLPANGSLTYQPNPDNANGNGKCNYNVLNLDGTPTRPTATGGSNVIIIGSGKF